MTDSQPEVVTPMGCLGAPIARETSPPACAPPTDFPPSRGRGSSLLLETAVSGLQPPGVALPSLIPSPIVSMRDHLGFARRLSPPRQLLRQFATQSDWASSVTMARIPAAIIVKRRESLLFLPSVGKQLRPLNARWDARLRADSPSAPINLALIEFLVRHLRYPDKHLARDLGRGMPIVGDVAPTGVLKKRGRPASTSFEDWRAGMLGRNLDMIKRVKESAGDDLAQKCWAKTLIEVQKGWLTHRFRSRNMPCATSPCRPGLQSRRREGHWARRYARSTT